MVIIVCDRCGERCSQFVSTAAQARRKLRAEDWKRRQGRDLCPGCASEKAAEDRAARAERKRLGKAVLA
jgi:hypothetical protein